VFNKKMCILKCLRVLRSGLKENAERAKKWLDTTLRASTSDRHGGAGRVSPPHAMCTGRSPVAGLAHDRLQLDGQKKR
jgi:hypothetical protein